MADRPRRPRGMTVIAVLNLLNVVCFLILLWALPTYGGTWDAGPGLTTAICVWEVANLIIGIGLLAQWTAAKVGAFVQYLLLSVGVFVFPTGSPPVTGAILITSLPVLAYLLIVFAHWSRCRSVSVPSPLAQSVRCPNCGLCSPTRARTCKRCGEVLDSSDGGPAHKS